MVTFLLDAKKNGDFERLEIFGSPNKENVMRKEQFLRKENHHFVTE